MTDKNAILAIGNVAGKAKIRIPPIIPPTVSEASTIGKILSPERGVKRSSVKASSIIFN